jgi:hypothetical protein
MKARKKKRIEKKNTHTLCRAGGKNGALFCVFFDLLDALRRGAQRRAATCGGLEKKQTGEKTCESLARAVVDLLRRA